MMNQRLFRTVCQLSCMDMGRYLACLGNLLRIFLGERWMQEWAGSLAELEMMSAHVETMSLTHTKFYAKLHAH
jgi:hypothetical protein